MSFAERIAEALAGTQSIALLGDNVRDDLFSHATAWGFRLATVNAAELATFGEGHSLWGSKSRAHWLLVIENCEVLDETQEDLLLDILFDGCNALPENTLIAAHFSQACNLIEMLDDPNVPVAYLAKTKSETVAEATGLPLVSTDIAGMNPADLRGIPLAA